MALFEGYERRIGKINGVLASVRYWRLWKSCKTMCEADRALTPMSITKGIQPICFEDAAWAYTVGAAIAIKKGVKTAAEAAEAIGIGLQAFCIPGSVAEDRKVGLGHGNLGAMLLRDETKCFAFLAGHESFAAAEGAIGIARSANTRPEGAPAGHPQRPGQGRGSDHQPDQRLHLCADPVRLLLPAN